MNSIIKIMTAAAIVATSGVPIAAPADAHASRYRHHHYRGKTVYAYRACRYSSGTTGLVAGGVGGAVVGSKVIGGPIGAIAGDVGGAVAGRAIDRSMTAPRRCRIYR
jgi:3D (Asp-Asp-Asp) domain-containing protein